jgi:hypothetical protein
MYGTYLRLCVNVHDSARAVIRATRKKIAYQAQRDPAYREARKRLYRDMLGHHTNEQRLFRTFRL